MAVRTIIYNMGVVFGMYANQLKQHSYCNVRHMARALFHGPSCNEDSCHHVQSSQSRSLADTQIQALQPSYI